MKRTHSLLPIPGFLLCAILLPGTVQQVGAQNAASVSRGKELYHTYGCYQCHGREGQGGINGPRLVPRVTPLIAFVAYIRHPNGNMPPYTSIVVSDAELADIEAFLRSIAPAQPVSELPLLNQ